MQRRLDDVDPDLFTDWRTWADVFVAGVCVASSAWRAAEAARRDAVALSRDPTLRRVGLAAEDAAWAVAHAAAGNLSLSLQRSAAAHQLLKLTV